MEKIEKQVEHQKVNHSFFKQFVFYLASTIYISQLEIFRLDSINAIVSGTFEMTMYEEGCDTIKITDGRFDIQYKY